MVDDLEERLSRYRADVDAAVAADLARRQLASPETGSHDTDPLGFDADHLMWLEPTTMSAPHGHRRVTLVASLGVVAAMTTLLIVALLVTRDDVQTPADQPSPTVTVPPTEPPRALFGTPGELLTPGTYFVDEVDGTPTPRIFVTVGAGWSNFIDDSIAKGGRGGFAGDDKFDRGFIAFSRPDQVYLDACHLNDGFYPGSLTTVDGLVTALMEQPGGWVDVTAPSDISIDGYVGKAFQRTAPADMSDCTTWDGSPRSSGNAVFSSWETADGINGGYAPGQIETLWVLDIDGTVVVISTELSPGPSATTHADFADAVLDSIRIDRP